MDADGPHRFRNGPFGRDVVQAPGGASDLSHSETRCAAFAGAGASSASTTCRFRESIPHPVQPLSTLRTPRCRDARKTRSRPACSALDGPDFHWQAHSSFPIAPRTLALARLKDCLLEMIFAADRSPLSGLNGSAWCGGGTDAGCGGPSGGFQLIQTEMLPCKTRIALRRGCVEQSVAKG